MSGKPSVLQIVIMRDGLLVGTEVFVPGSYTLGSAASSDLKLDDPSVGPRHAVLYFQNGRAAIQDQQSSGGIFVNGHKVQSCELRPMDEVTCGPFVLKARVLANKPEDDARPPPEIAAILSAEERPGEPTRSMRATAASVRGPHHAPRPPPVAVGMRPTVQGTPPSNGLPPALADTDIGSPGPGALSFKPPPPSTPKYPGPAQQQTAFSARRLEMRQHPAAASALSPLTVTQPELVSEVFIEDPFGDDELHAKSTKPHQIGDLIRESLKTNATAKAPSRGAAASAGVRPPAFDPKAKGRAHLFIEVFWGDHRVQAKAFAPGDAQVMAAEAEDATVPLYGFGLKDAVFHLADRDGKTYRLYVPPGAGASKVSGDGRTAEIVDAALEKQDDRRFTRLAKGDAVRMTHGDFTLLAYSAPRQKKPFANPLRGTPWLALGLLTAFAAAFGTFLSKVPKFDTADFVAAKVNPVAVRLVAPPKAKREETQKKLAKMKAAAAEKTARKQALAATDKTKPREKAKLPSVPTDTPEAKAMQALAKLSAGPAMNDLLANLDKGNGPGSKNAKRTDYKLGGLLGKTAVANAGTGNFGLGNGGGGGTGALGAGVLRGKGSGGIGALGAGSVGRNAVGGTVTRAPTRSIGMGGSGGTIDREAIAKTVDAHFQEVRACYERALLKNPGLAGKVTLEWKISTEGRVLSVRSKTSTLPDAQVEGCILNALKTWQFPKAKGGEVTVTYPFIFNSVGY